MSKFNLNAFADEAGLDLQEQIKALVANGYCGLEIRRIGNKNITELSVSEAKEVKERLSGHGLYVWSIGSPIGKVSINDNFEKHMDVYKQTLELSAILGAKAFRLFSFYMPKGQDPVLYKEAVIEKLGKMCDEAKKYDVLLCHENEKGIFGDVAERCLMIHRALPDLGCIFDPANFVQCNQDTLEAWEKLKTYVSYLHIKDATMDGNVVPAGKGVGNVLRILKDFYAMGGKELTLEPHLKIFAGMQGLEKDFDANKIGQQFVYPTERDAFDAAVEALNALIEEV